jgi:lipopolysaccharide export system ATP-binding protein
LSRAGTEAALCGEALVKRYGSKEAVCGVDVRVAPREVVGLLGPNGAGKTTIFAMLAGQLAPTSGRVRLGARNVTALPMFVRARLGITYLPQETSIFRRLTVAGNVEAILESVEPDRRVRRARLEELLSELGLADKAGRRADSLSGGERRRLEITRALVLDPAFMLLDEPFAGIDPLAVADMQKIVGLLRGRGIGVMITDHNVRETLSICSRAYIIKDGTILKHGGPDEIARDPRVREVYLGENFRLV